MGGIGPEKILLIIVVLLLLFGAKRIPEIGASLGKGIREFKGSLSDKGEPHPAEMPRQSAPPQSTPRPTEETPEPKRLLP